MQQPTLLPWDESYAWRASLYSSHRDDNDSGNDDDDNNNNDDDNDDNAAARSENRGLDQNVAVTIPLPEGAFDWIRREVAAILGVWRTEEEEDLVFNSVVHVVEAHVSALEMGGGEGSDTRSLSALSILFSPSIARLFWTQFAEFVSQCAANGWSKATWDRIKRYS